MLNMTKMEKSNRNETGRENKPPTHTHTKESANEEDHQEVDMKMVHWGLIETTILSRSIAFITIKFTHCKPTSLWTVYYGKSSIFG